MEEEEEAREQEEDKRQEEAVDTRMQRLEAEVLKYAGRDRSQLSDLERAAVVLVAHSDALRRRRERRRKLKMRKKKKKLPHGRVSRGRACRRLRQLHVSGSPGDVLLCAVFPLFVVRPEIEGPLQLFVQGGFGLLRCTSRCFLFPGSQAHDARHHGRHAPEGQLPGIFLRPLVSGSHLFVLFA